MLTKIAIVDKDEKYLENFNKYMSDKSIKCYSYITIKDYINDKEIYDFDIVLINEDYKTKEKKGKNVIILLNELNNESDDMINLNDKYFYKYQNMNNLLKIIYKIINDSFVNDEIKKEIETEKYESISANENHEVSKDVDFVNKVDDYKNIVVYNVSNSNYIDNYIDKLVINIMPKSKKMVWNFEMFSNELSDDGMDIAVALGSKNILNNESFLNKLKKINDETYSFYPLTNPYDFIELSSGDYVDINNKLKTLDFKCNISIIKGNISPFINDVINYADTFILLYTKYDEIKKDKVKNYFSFIKRKYNNIAKEKLIELKLTHSKKDYLLLNNIRGMIC